MIFCRCYVTLMLIFAAAAHADCGLSTENQYGKLVSLIQERNVSNTQGLLTAIKNDSCFSEMLRNPILNPVSFALHNKLVSPAFPRIVLFKQGLTFMFIGNPAEPAAQILEVISFDQVNLKFQFSLINFNTPDQKLRFIADASEFDFFALEKTDPTFKDLANCGMCHRMEATESRPRWGTSPLFQVPFGQADERINRGSRQFEQWQTFQLTLSDPEKGALYRYLDIETKTDADGNISFPKRPNSSLTQELEDHNLDRVARILRSAPGYGKKRFALAKVLQGDYDIRSFFSPEEWHQRLDQVRKSLGTGRANDAMKALPDDAFVAAITKDTTEQNRMSLRTVLDRVESPMSSTAHFDLTGVVFAGLKLEQLPEEDVISTILKPEERTEKMLNSIRLLFDGDMSENADSWSTSKSSPFGDSYRFNRDFLDHLLRGYILPDIEK